MTLIQHPDRRNVWVRKVGPSIIEREVSGNSQQAATPEETRQRIEAAIEAMRCRLCGDPITAPLYRKVPVHRKCWEMEKGDVVGE